MTGTRCVGISFIVPMFVATGGHSPRYLVELGEGHVEPADQDVMLELAGELHLQAERARERLRQLLASDLGSVDLPAAADEGEPQANLVDARVADNTPSKGAPR